MTLAFRHPNATAETRRPVRDLTVIVPCYNEAERLRSDAFLRFVDETPRARILFVNDGSRDATLDRLRDLVGQRPLRMSVLNLPRNQGKAEAVRSGLCHALKQGAELVAYWDADLATPLDLIEDFLRVADRNPDLEVVFGSRRRMLGHRVQRTLPRRVVSAICAVMARLAIGLPITDTQCGAKLLRNTPALAAALDRPFSAGWLFDVELFARIARGGGTSGHRFYELPLSEWQEVPGSKVSTAAIVKSGFRMLRLIAELRLWPAPAGIAAADAAPVEYKKAA